jgi:hypothetical protein
MRRGRWFAFAALLAAVSAVGIAPQSAWAACSTSDLKPVLREVVINQGLSSYANFVDAKEGMARLLLSLPRCADSNDSIQLQSVTATISNGTTQSSPLPTSPDPLGPVYPRITTTYSATLPPNDPANPIIPIPGAVLASLEPSTGPWTARFTFSVTFRPDFTSASDGSGLGAVRTLTYPESTKTVISKKIAGQSRALRLLAVPLHQALSTAATDQLQQSMIQLARAFPAPDSTGTPNASVGDITDTFGAIRYRVNAGPLDLTGLLTSGQFCSTGSNFTTVKTKLNDFLQAWNAANGAFPADRVGGVGDPALMVGAADDPSCFEGVASLVSPEALWRVSTLATPIMEIGHTFNAVPSARSSGSYHAASSNVDYLSGDVNRAYNVRDRLYLADDRNAMKFDTTGWDAWKALYWRDDYSLIHCKMGGPTTTECTTAGNTGTLEGVPAAAPVLSFVMTGTVNAPPSPTANVTSYVHETLPTPTDPASPYRLRWYAANTLLADQGVPVSFLVTHPFEQVGQGVVSIAFPLVAGATRVEFIHTSAPGTPLYEAEDGDAPVIDNVTITGGSGGSSGAPTISTTTTTTVTSKGNKGTNSPAGKAARRPAPEQGAPPQDSSERFLLSSHGSITTVTKDATGASQLATAIAAVPTQVTSASFSEVPPNGSPNGVASGALSDFPRNGSTYSILTSGDVQFADDANTSTSTGADNGGGAKRGTSDRDVVVLKMDLAVPATANCLAVDLKFFSEEFPEFVNRQFNDAFIAELDTSNWTTTSGSAIQAPNNFAYDQNEDLISINTSGNAAMSSANASGTTYDGATPLLTATTPITPGAHSVYFSIFDQGDNVYDTAVFLDNLRLFSSSQCQEGVAQTTTVSVTDADTDENDLRAIWYLNPNDPNDSTPDEPIQVLEVNDEPTVEDGTATFSITTILGCPDCTVEAFVYDGWDSAVSSEDSILNTLPLTPTASAFVQQTVGQYDEITGEGTGVDFRDGVITTGTWSAPTLFVGTRTGSRLNESPDANGWTDGSHDITFTVTDSSGKSDSVTLTIFVKDDDDHDGLFVEEGAGFACDGFGPDADNNPYNKGADPDGDGIPNNADPEPCTPATSYPADQAVFVGDGVGKLVLSKDSLTVSANGIHLAYAPEPGMESVPFENVKIVAVNDVSLASPITAVKGSGKDSVGTYGFSRAPVEAALAPHVGHEALLDIEGTSTNGWKFEASVRVQVLP